MIARPRVGLLKWRGTLFLSILAAVSAISIFQCDDNDNRIIIEHPLQTIAGAVFDSVSVEPIGNAWVGLDSTIGNYDALTDSLGNYVFQFVGPSGETPIFCGSERYHTQVKYADVESPDTVNVDFKLIRR